MGDIKQIINKIIETLSVNASSFYLYLNKGEIEIKQIKSVIVNNVYSLDEFKQATGLDKNIVAKLFDKKGIFVYSDYIVYVGGNVIRVVKRDNNFLVQALYKGGKDKDISKYFSPFGYNIITGDYTYEALADIIDLIGDHSLITALYNFRKNKKLFNDIENTSDLSLIEVQYKYIKNEYQDIINKFKIIYNGIDHLSWKEIQYANDKIILPTDAEDLAREAQLGIYLSDKLSNIKHLNYNSIILHQGNVLSYIDKIKKILVDSIYKQANIIDIRSIDFVKRWYIVDIYKYRADVDDFVLEYSNKEGLVDLIEEKLAPQLHGDARIKAQWNSLKKTLI